MSRRPILLSASKSTPLAAPMPASVRRAFVPALLTLALAGCAVSGSPRFDAGFGDSVRALQAQQVLDAQASTRNTQSPSTTDGRASREAMERYMDTYRAPPQPQNIVLGVGGGNGGGGGGAAR